MYYNYHKHDHKGNVKSLDVVVKMEDYCKRAVELGHNAIFTTNHGIQGDIFEALTLGEQYGLKVIVGCEMYYVLDRLEKDRSNKHVVIIALNNDGVKQLNSIISKANVDGYYYKPRIDRELLFSLNPNNFVITTACVAGLLYDEQLVSDLKDKFNDNFLLETQTHNEEIQKEFNQLAIDYSEKYNIKLIHGNDSHYIKPDDSKYRELFLKAKGIIYDHENSFILDYPDRDTIVNRYRKQGVLSEQQINETINNTLIFDKAEEITYINYDIKLPSMDSNANKELKRIVRDAWIKEKVNIPNSRWKEYTEAIKYEMDIIEKTKMEDYFILDYKMVQLAQDKYGGKLTHTGRGSAPSFYITKLLGLTDIDRLDSHVTLFPTRFMSIERILGAKSLPDIDLNTSDATAFIKATEDLLGEENCAWMISWKPLQNSSAFRLWCKANDMNVSEYDNIAKDLDNFTDDEYWKDIILDSKIFVGVVESMSESPCSMLVYDKNVSEEIGLVRTNNKICCMLDGYNCDKYKYLKNDLLTVSVWAIIKNVCDLANIKIPSIKELDLLLDDKTYEIYEKGLTCTINQADSDFATGLIKRYKPKSVSEMSSFVSIIRPGCASLLNDFLDRKDYTTGVEELDNILVEGQHRMIYQELIMKYLIWLGVKESISYDIIKKISKKKFKEKELIELKEKLLSGWIEHIGSEEGFEETWEVVNNASKYSFNASHSLSYAYDSLYGAYLKSHYPLEYYSVAFNQYFGDITRTGKLTNELSNFGIALSLPRFGYSKGEYFFNKETNTIYKGIGSIKGLGIKDGEELYELSKIREYNDFIDLYNDIKHNTSVNDGKIKALIKLDFFFDYGHSQYLLDILDVYNKFNDIKQINKSKIEILGIKEDVVKKFCSKETKSLFKEIDNKGLIKELISDIENKETPLKLRLQYEIELLGYPNTIVEILDDNLYFTIKIDEFKNKKSNTYYATFYNIKTGDEIKYRVSDYRVYMDYPFKVGDVVNILNESRKPRRRLVDGNWEIVKNEFNNMLDYYEVY